MPNVCMKVSSSNLLTVYDPWILNHYFTPFPAVGLISFEKCFEQERFQVQVHIYVSHSKYLIKTMVCCSKGAF